METNSLTKAAYLTLKGHRITIVGPYRFVFDPAAQHDADDFDSGATVPAAIYGEAITRLRRLVSEKAPLPGTRR
jgi:hypothetical protein